MSILDKIDKMLLSEGKLRGFKDKRELGLEIENMEMNVEPRDKKELSRILNKALKRVDPEMQLSVVKAIMKLKDRDAANLYDELLDLHYND